MNGGNYNIKFESDDSANSLLGLSNPSLLANNSSQQYDADSASAAVVGMSNLTEPGAPAEGESNYASLTAKLMCSSKPVRHTLERPWDCPAAGPFAEAED